MLIPPNRHSSAIMADSLLPKDRKKQLMQEITLEPAGGGGGGAEGEKTDVRGPVRTSASRFLCRAAEQAPGRLVCFHPATEEDEGDVKVTTPKFRSVKKVSIQAPVKGLILQTSQQYLTQITNKSQIAP